jgi:outer membrane lipoprotein-sorting protein
MGIQEKRYTDVKYNMKRTYLFVIASLVTFFAEAQSVEELVNAVKAKLARVSDYQATGKMKTNVVFIKAPIATVKVFYKKPDRLRISNEQGISFIPKGSVNINVNNLFLQNDGFDMIDMGTEKGTGFRIVKLLPKDEEADVVLSTLYIDPVNALVRKSKTTTRENGTYELELSYGKYSEYGLADHVIFSFNTKDYKLPKGITFDYDDGTKKNEVDEKMKNRKGRIEIRYSDYVINKGIPDDVFK